MSNQTQINFERSEQLGLIRRAILPAAGCIKPDKLKAVLRVIDDHAGQYGWCYVSQATIASEACMPFRTVQRAIEVLRDHLGVILTEKRQSEKGTVVNHTRIVWTELAVLCLRHDRQNMPVDHCAKPEERCAKSEERCAKSEERCAKSEERCAKSEERCASSGANNRKRLGSAQEAPPPPTPSRSWAAAAAALESSGVRMVSRAIDDAQQRGHQPDDVLGWCDEFRRWASRFKGPAAILWRIREGCWPVELPDSRTVEASAERVRAETCERAHGRRFHEIVIRSRRARLPDDEIRERLRSELPEEFLVSQGW